MKSLQPFFKVDELAARWGVTRDAVLSYGANGQLQCGVFVTGFLAVEIHDGDELVSTGFWSGFIPVTPQSVAELWLNGKSASMQVLNTDCGKLVFVANYLPSSELDDGPVLVVDSLAVEAFEKSGAITECGVSTPADWRDGIRNVAWAAAVAISNRNDKLTANRLEKEMLATGAVELRNDAFHLKNPAFGLIDRQTWAKPKTIAGWVTDLKKIL